MSEPNTQPIDDDIIDSESEITEDDVDEITEVEATETDHEAVESTSASASNTDEMDIDAALAAVSQLTFLAQDEPDDISDADYQAVASDDHAEQTYREPQYEFEQPHDLTMSRGQLASVIPAVSLIIFGGWLTFTLTTSNTPPNTSLLFSIVLIAIGVIFLSQWLSSARWSRGNFFIGASTLLIGGIQLYLSQTMPAMLNTAWSFWIVAIGIALFGAGYVSLPRLNRISLMGMLTIITGIIAYILTSGVLDSTVIGFVSNLWFVGVAVIGFFIIAPFIRRR